MKNFSDPDGKVREDFPGGWPTDTVDKFTEKGRSDLENEVFDYIRTLANYRKENAVLRTGKLMQFVPEDAVYVYFRYDDDKTVMVIMNTNEHEAVVKMARFAERFQGVTHAKNIISGEIVSVVDSVSLGAKSTLVLELINP